MGIYAGEGEGGGRKEEKEEEEKEVGVGLSFEIEQPLTTRWGTRCFMCIVLSGALTSFGQENLFGIDGSSGE